MIGVTLVMHAQPGKAEELAELWRQVAIDVPAAEPGCRQISVLRNAADPEQFVIFELYESQAALDHHHGTDYSAAMGPKLQGLRVAPIQRFVGPIIA